MFRSDSSDNKSVCGVPRRNNLSSADIRRRAPPTDISRSAAVVPELNGRVAASVACTQPAYRTQVSQPAHSFGDFMPRGDLASVTAEV